MYKVQSKQIGGWRLVAVCEDVRDAKLIAELLAGQTGNEYRVLDDEGNDVRSAETDVA